MKKHKGQTIRKVGKYTVINCKSCKFIHVHPIPSNEELYALYNNDYYQKTKPDYIVKNSEKISCPNCDAEMKLEKVFEKATQYKCNSCGSNYTKPNSWFYFEHQTIPKLTNQLLFSNE